MRRALLRRCALGKPEVADTCPPVEAGGRQVVLIGIVEGAVISGINSKIAIISPAILSSTLAAGSVEKMLLT